MVAVSFFFVLTGVIFLFAGLLGLFLQQLFADGKHRWGKQSKKWLVIAGVGLLGLVLGLLMAMTG